MKDHVRANLLKYQSKQTCWKLEKFIIIIIFALFLNKHNNYKH